MKAARHALAVTMFAAVLAAFPAVSETARPRLVELTIITRALVGASEPADGISPRTSSATRNSPAPTAKSSSDASTEEAGRMIRGK